MLCPGGLLAIARSPGPRSRPHRRAAITAYARASIIDDARLVRTPPNATGAHLQLNLPDLESCGDVVKVCVEEEQWPPSESPRVGRRPGNQDTRGQIITAARQAFAAKGFAGASMRGIAVRRRRGCGA